MIEDEIRQLLSTISQRKRVDILNKLIDEIQGFFHHLLIKLNRIYQEKEPKPSNNLSKLLIVAESIKSLLSNNNALSPNENIHIPTWSSDFSSFTDSNTLSVDAFLYTNDQVEHLVDTNQFPSHFCLDCKGTRVELLNYISHSASHCQLEYIFSVALANEIKKDTHILDIGSRLGPVLYSAFYMTRSNFITGIEMNPYFTNLQQKTIEKFEMTDRVFVYEDNIMSLLGRKEIQKSQVIILNNVFQFFSQENKQIVRDIWEFIKKWAKKDSILVTMPGLEEQLKEIESEICFEEWVIEFHADGDLTTKEYTEEEVESIENVHFYRVL